MDSIVHTGLEQICSHGTTGITLPNLWSNLQSPLPLCPNVKKALWLNLINIPDLQFESRGVFYSAEDEAIKEVDKCEMMGLKIVAAEQLRNSFVGIYDIKASDAGVSMPQRRVLERLAIARTNGITQSELAKELGIKGNNIFYVLKNLESRGLIVRQSTILRKKEAGNEGEPKSSSIVNTNMLYLYRYAKHLGCQQRLEITKEDKTLVGNDNEDGSAASSVGVADQCVKEDVHVKDYLPALKAICDKLEKAAGKVLVISDIKRHLGYRGTSGHRAWRNICHRLKDARVVEEFCAQVNKKVLRIYYDKRQKRRTRLRGVPNNQGADFRPLRNNNVSSPRKRKRSSDGRSLKPAKVDNLDGELNEQRHDILSVTNDQFTEDQNFFITSSGDDENNSLKDHVDDHMETREEPGSNEEDEESHSFIRKCALLSRLNSTRRRRFSWTEMADRQLVIEYVRHRAALGADFHRADWASLPNLPAPPVTCKRRMALLNSSIQFRKAVMRLCNILSERYAKHLSKFQIRSLDDDSRVMIRHNSYGEDCNRNLSNSLEHIEAYDSEERWDDFDDENLKIALDEVLRYKRMAKFASVSEEHSYLNIDAEGHEYEGTKLDSSAIPSEDVQNYSGRSRVSARRTRFHRLPRKYIKLLNEEIGVSRCAYGSLAVSNAAELFKLVFLSTSTAPQVPNLLAETLRRYSEHDLFAAFDYLREKKIMVGGNGSSPFVLSQQFLQRISSSPFPSNTGKRAAKFASWLHEREKDLIEEGVDLTADLQCGDVLHLFALVSSGELLISPCLPDQGVGEAEDSRTSKRKSDNYEFESGDKSKKPKPLLAGEGEIISRREKGFPGIKLSLSCATISGIDAVEIFKNLDICSAPFPIRGSDEVKLTMTQNVDSNSSPSNNHMMEILNSRATIPTTVAANESPWKAMTCYAKNLVSVPSNQEQGSFLSSELFKTVYSAIQMAGDQGLRIEEIRKMMNAPGEKMPELIVEVLETFGHALKVNGYDSIHVVDSLYRSKYFLTSMAGYYPDHKVDHQSANSKGVIDDNRLILQQNHHEYDGGNVQKEISSNVDEVHRVTILNLPEEVPQPSSEVQKTNEIEGNMQAKIVSSGRYREGEVSEFSFGDSNLCSPILPWINGDGTVNEIVYKGLIRRVLGLVMQNPGILEDDILMQMRILNPQSCKTLLELMILDNHIIVRKMNQATSVEPPALLGCLFGSSFEKSKLICRKHFFANPFSTGFL